MMEQQNKGLDRKYDLATQSLMRALISSAGFYKAIALTGANPKGYKLSEIKDRVRTIEEYLVHVWRGLYNLSKTYRLTNLSSGQLNNLKKIKIFLFYLKYSMGFNFLAISCHSCSFIRGCVHGSAFDLLTNEVRQKG